MNRFERGPTQVLYRYLPGAIFEHDRYGLCIVDSVDVESSDRLNEQALFEALSDALQEWHRHGNPPAFPDPRDERQRRQYRIGRPREVHFRPFPTTLQCRKCGHVFRLREGDRFHGRCPREGCGGKLVQMRYVEAHNCGRLEEIHLPDRGCSQHGRRHLRFYDPGRVQRARWVCGICGQEIQKPRMTPCNCRYSQWIRSADRGQRSYERFLRLYPTGEPGLYIPHVTAFVNFNQSEESQLSTLNPDGHAALLARWWGLLEGPVMELLKRRAMNPSEIKGEVLELLESLRKIAPDKAREYEEQLFRPPGQKEIERVKGMIPLELLTVPPPRRLVEHIILLDSGRHQLTTTKQLGDAVRAELEKLGLLEVTHIDDFPVALLAFGYSRVARDPRRSLLNAFPADEEGRIPLFVLPTETEGLWFQLDPQRVLGWLIQNGLLSGALPESREEAWARLYREILANEFRSDRVLTIQAQAILYLLHTMSHILLQRIEWSGFSPQSLGEYFMPETLSFVLFVNRFDGARIGGLATLFSLRLKEWLQDSAQGGRYCLYDPLCGESGASCAGCLHREHNCLYFNRYLSRSVLYGGDVDWERMGSTEIQHGYWAEL